MSATRIRPDCPLDRIVRVLAGPWTALVLHRLQHDGPLHFGALRRAVDGVSAKVLTERLRRLERAGLVERSVVAGKPALVRYGLSRRGQDLQPVLDTLDRLAERWSREDAA